MKQKYVFGSEQNAVTEKGRKIIVPEDVAKRPEAWLDKRFPVMAWGLDRLGWYRYSKQAMIVQDEHGHTVRSHGMIMVRFFDRRRVGSVGSLGSVSKFGSIESVSKSGKCQ